MADRVTIAQVAAEAGVSATTVSNVLNNRPGASEATRRMVHEVAAGLGYGKTGASRLRYGTDFSDRNLQGGHSGLIGVVALDLTALHGLEIIGGIVDELTHCERETLITASYQDSRRERENIEFLTGGLVDGVLLVAPRLDVGTLEVIGRSLIPCVVIAPRLLNTRLPRLSVDNYRGMRGGAQHLLDQGHRRIAYIRGEDDLESSSLRFQGFADAMWLAGLEVAAELVATCDFSYAGGFRAAASLLAQDDITAIVAGADLIALGAVDAARAHGLTVPDDLSVLGFDDLPQAFDSFPGLTTVRQPLHDMGQKGAKALLSLIDGHTLVTDDIRLPTELIVRGTTCAPPNVRARRDRRSR